MSASASSSVGVEGGGFHFGQGERKWRFLVVEVFVALSLSVAYYFIVSMFASGTSNNYTNSWVFSSCSVPVFHLESIYDVWKGRLSGLLLSGYLFDFTVHGDTFNFDQFARFFGLYNSAWLLALFSIIILATRRSLLINFGIFAGLIYNLSPVAGLYFYPWDVPATLFFTLAVILFERRRMPLMIAAICVGCFFKETVLACAVLLLFVHDWRWGKRMAIFLSVVAFYVFGKKLLTNHLGIIVAAFSMGEAKTWLDLLRPEIVMTNIKAFFSPTLNHVIFTNGGTLVAVLLVGWCRRFLPYMALIVFVVGAQLYYAAWTEFRIFMQILPLSIMILSERWQSDVERAALGPGAPAAVPPSTGQTEYANAPWTGRDTLPALLLVCWLLIVLPTAFAGWRYWVVSEALAARTFGLSDIGKHTLKAVGQVPSLQLESQVLRDGYVEAELELGADSDKNHELQAAVGHYQRALSLNTNSVPALNNLAWLLATAAAPEWREGTIAVRFAEQACQLTDYGQPILLGTLAAAYAEAGRFDDAVATAEKARTLALAQGQEEIAARNAEMMQLYKSGHPYHQSAKSSP